MTLDTYADLFDDDLDAVAAALNDAKTLGASPINLKSDIDSGAAGPPSGPDQQTPKMEMQSAGV